MNEQYKRFEATLAEQFEKLFQTLDYARVAEKHTPAEYASLYTTMLSSRRRADKNGLAVKNTCMVLGIKNTYKDIEAFLRGDKV
jgi:hypothetical protein